MEHEEHERRVRYVYPSIQAEVEEVCWSKPRLHLPIGPPEWLLGWET